jgi:hypothetical protein
MLAKARPPLVESKMAARHKCLDVHESYMQGCQDTRDQKYEVQMLHPSSVVNQRTPTLLLEFLMKLYQEKVLCWNSRLTVSLIFLLLQRLSYLNHWQNRQLTKLKKRRRQRCPPYKQPLKHLAIMNHQRVCLHTENIIHCRPLHCSLALRHPIKGYRLMRSMRSIIILAATTTSTMVTLLVSINSGLDTLARLDLHLSLRFLTHTIITHHTDHGE